RCESRAQLRSPRRVCRFPNQSRVFMRVAIETARCRRIVREDRSASKLLSRPVEQIIDEFAIFEQAKLEVNRGEARGDSQIILRELNHIAGLRIVELARIKHLAPGDALLLAQALPSRICFQIAPKMAQRLRSVEL